MYSLNKSPSIWLLSMDKLDDSILNFSWVLTSEDYKKAKRLIPDKRMKQYLKSCIALKILLSLYQESLPQKCTFQYNQQGKPYIDSTKHDENFEFNISRSGDFLLFGFDKKNKIGVDIEAYRKIDHLESLIDLTLTSEEKAIFHALPNFKKNSYFLRVWTCKEAFTKAIGLGLSYPLDKIQVIFSMSNQLKSIKIMEPQYADQDWQLFTYEKKNEYIFCCATQQNGIAPIIYYTDTFIKLLKSLKAFSPTLES